jgi:acetolactate synthase-1/2/3 large subunit
MIVERTAQIRGQVLAEAQRGNQQPMSKAYVSWCLSNAIQGYQATVLSELGCPLAPLDLRAANSWYQEPHSGGLGWSLPCAMGMQLADPERLIVATMGDGSYMFANPTACHQIMEAYGIPVLIIILNNAEWGAVRHSVQGLYPRGYASKTKRMPLTALAPSPDFTKTAEASRAWARQVTDPEQLPEMLKEAIRTVTGERRTALLDVKIAS